MAPNNVSGSGRRIGYSSTQHCCWDDVKDYKIKCVNIYYNTYEHECTDETNMLSNVCLRALGTYWFEMQSCGKSYLSSQIFPYHDAFETMPSSINQYTAARGRLWPCVAVADPGKTLQDCGWIGPCHFSRREPWWLSAGSFGFGDRKWLLSFIYDEPNYPMVAMA